ncbi:MAG: hypothetical protein JSV04_13270 [Candidatus Heimdallarchaeota archaeon]|nr:MAG: hypothetical protein JSV04_13270 [Candidatus Heimdallarchaeota archaeon]
MRFLGFISSKRHQGQMFILATMLIAVYIVAMAAILINLGGERIEVECETLREPYLDSKRELQLYLELVLAEYSKNGAITPPANVLTEIEEFMASIEVLNSVRGVTTNFQFDTNSFLLSANKPPYENTFDGAVYISQIYAEFTLHMSAISSSISLDESFSINFTARVEIRDNKIIVQQSTGDTFEHVQVSSIYILNGSTTLVPYVNREQTGVYYFEDESYLDDLGILNVTLMNGVHVLS